MSEYSKTPTDVAWEMARSEDFTTADICRVGRISRGTCFHMFKAWKAMKAKGRAATGEWNVDSNG